MSLPYFRYFRGRECPQDHAWPGEPDRGAWRAAEQAAACMQCASTGYPSRCGLAGMGPCNARSSRLDVSRARYGAGFADSLLASGERRQEGDRIAGRQLGRVPGEPPDVLVVDVDIDVGAQLPVVGKDPRPEVRMGADCLEQRILDGMYAVPTNRNLALAAREPTQLSGQPDSYVRAIVLHIDACTVECEWT